MASQEVTGPSVLTILAGQTSTSGQYTASKAPATWSVAVQNDGALDAGEYTVTVSALGLVTVTLLPGATIPPTGVTMSLVVSASSGNGNGNNDSLIVSVQIDADAVPCFVAGTLIDTETGSRPVEELQVGDRVLTHDGNSKKIRWVGSRRLDSQSLRNFPNLRPVLIKRDALGQGRPKRDLYVSPQHRIFICGWRAELLFGEYGVLVPAVHLVNDQTIIRSPSNKPVMYYHFATEQHQIVFANSLPAETLYPGDMALSTVTHSDALELLTIFPELLDPSGKAAPSLYARCLRGHEGQIIGAIN